MLKLAQALIGSASSKESPRICISGTGRAGTTFLVQLFTALGFDTGAAKAKYFDNARAGLEYSIFDPDAPRVLKSPFLCDQVDSALSAGIAIDHVIIPIRRFKDAAASRAHVQKTTTGKSDGSGVAGGLWETNLASDQEAILRHKLTNLIESLVLNDIPMTFLSFPRSATDAEYTYKILRPIMSGVSFRKFQRAFSDVSKPGLINTFGQ